MAVRTAYAPVAGTAITAANHAKFPGGWIGYAEVTANQTGFTAASDISSLTVTVTAGTTRRLKASVYTRIRQNSNAANPTVTILEAGSQVQASAITSAISGDTQHSPWVCRTPSSGSIVYKAQLSTGAGTADVTASATAPACILVEDVGPAS